MVKYINELQDYISSIDHENFTLRENYLEAKRHIIKIHEF
jgi:hypothetical protein